MRNVYLPVLAIMLWSLLLGISAGTLLAGCNTAKDVAHAGEHALIDCGKGELANIKPIAVAMAKSYLAGSLTREDLKGTAIQSGARFGGCLLAHLHDALPKPMGFVGEPTEAELMLVDLRAATGTDYAYKTESGAH